MSYEKLGFVSGQTLKAEHLNYMEDGIANAGGVTSWNDLQDKPFYSEITEGVVEFDGDLTGREWYDMGGGGILIKASDTPLTMEELLGSTVIVKHNIKDFGAIGDTAVEIIATEENTVKEEISESAYAISMFSEFDVPAMHVIVGDLSSVGLTAPEGTYFVYMTMNEEYFYTQSISCLSGMQEKVHKIDKKYLPEVGLKADKVKAMIDEAMEATISEEAVSEMINNAIGAAIGGSY